MDIIVIGTGGLAREFSAFFASQLNIVGFASNNEDEHKNFGLQKKFFGGEIDPQVVGTKNAVIAVGSPSAKRTISDDLKASGFVFPNLIHPMATCAVRFDNVKSEGVIISPNCVVGSHVTFSDHVYINFMVGIGHDTSFSKFVQVNPGAQIGGAVSIGEGALIGSGATIRQGLKVGKFSTVGVGSTVLSSVREDSTVIGNPAKRLKLPRLDS